MKDEDRTPEQRARAARLLGEGPEGGFEKWLATKTAGWADERKARFVRLLNAEDEQHKPHKPRGRVRRRTRDNSID